MVPAHLTLAVSAYGVAAIGLLGSLVGGAITGAATYTVALQSRRAAEKSWIRDTRRELFDRLLTAAQDLQAACEMHHDGAPSEESSSMVEKAFREFFNTYAVVQTVAESRVVDAARVYGYRLHELRDEALGKPGRLTRRDFALVDKLVRLARHDTVDAMREELGLSGSARPPDGFNAFAGTELENNYI